jgi:8-oxo-dGTP pyrophosphatase MutT (NUDIX family)
MSLAKDKWPDQFQQMLKRATLTGTIEQIPVANVLMHNPDYDTPISAPPLVLKSAAVLIVLWYDPKADTDCEILLTVRQADLPQHAGQVALPGGTRNPKDSSLLSTALRETHEEIGLPPDWLEHPERLPDFVALSGFRITTFIAFCPKRNLETLTPDPREVSTIFTVPLAHCLNAEAYELKRMTHRQQARAFYELPGSPHRIWGVTAGILWGFQRWFWQLSEQNQ